MAEKPGFLMMHKTFRALDKLPDAQFRAMLRAMCDYSESGTEPAFDDPAMEAIFMTIREWLDMDAARYDKRVERSKRAAAARWGNAQAYANIDGNAYDANACLQSQVKNQSQIQVQVQDQIQNQVQSLSLSEREGPERERPTLEMVLKYAQEAGLEVDARQFIAQNEATGWVDGNGQPVKNWRIWLQGWALRNRPGGAAKPTPTATAFEQRTYSAEELKAMTDADFEDALKNYEKGKREDNG